MRCERGPHLWLCIALVEKILFFGSTINSLWYWWRSWSVLFVIENHVQCFHGICRNMLFRRPGLEINDICLHVKYSLKNVVYTLRNSTSSAYFGFLGSEGLRWELWQSHGTKNIHSVHPHPPPFLLGGGWTSYQIFKKGSLIGPQLLEGGWWERSEWLFSGGCNFYIKDKVKSEIFNDKKSLKTQIFFCHNEEFELGNFN